MAEPDDDPWAESAASLGHGDHEETKTRVTERDGTRQASLGDVPRRMAQGPAQGVDVWARADSTPRVGTQPKSKAPSSPQMEQVLKQRKKEGSAGKTQD